MSRVYCRNLVFAVGCSFVLVSCGKDYFISYPPIVRSTDPIDKSDGVEVDASIKITFSDDMDESSLNNLTVQVNNNTAGEITYSNKTATFTPIEPMEYSTRYTVVLSDQIEDENGNKMKGGYTFSFTTNIPPPIITDFTPKSGFEGTHVTITGMYFGNTEPANLVKIDGKKVIIISSSNTELIIEIPTYAQTSAISLTTRGGNDKTDTPFSVIYHGMYWTERNTGYATDLNDIVYNGSIYVAVGNNGMIYHSDDAETWYPHQSGSNYDLYGVAYGNDMFVAVGAAGRILRSEDGSLWEESVWSTEITLFDVSFGDDSFIAVGSGGTIIFLTEEDGWVQREINLGNWFYDVVWSGVTFVIVGSTGSLLTSPNQVLWYDQDSPVITHLLGAAWGEPAVVAVGYDGVVVNSPTGAEWTRRVTWTTEHLLGVAGYDSRFIAVGQSGTIISSIDHGTTWVIRQSSSIADLTEILWDGTRFIAIGLDGVVLISN